MRCIVRQRFCRIDLMGPKAAAVQNGGTCRCHRKHCQSTCASALRTTASVKQKECKNDYQKQSDKPKLPHMNTGQQKGEREQNDINQKNSGKPLFIRNFHSMPPF